MWFLKPAARQDITLHSGPPSGCVWARVCVNVLGGAHHRAGNAPRYRTSKSAAYITAPSAHRNSAFAERRFASGLLCATASASASRKSANSHSALPFRSRRRPRRCSVLKSTTSSVNTANKGGRQSADQPQPSARSRDQACGLADDGTRVEEG